MKRFIPFFICSIILFAVGMASVHAQENNFDSDIHAIRNNAVPDFRYRYDDYLQYSPAGALILMKSCGYESRSSWGRMLTSDAFSAAFMATAVNGLKYTVRRMRPDGSRRNSFPSGHTATSFMTATMLYKEYGWQSPWFSIGAYTVATVSGVSRILNNRHWMTDVIAGAAIGIGSVHLGYYLGDLIFKDKGLSASYAKPSFLYDSDLKYYVAELSFGHRHFIGSGKGYAPVRGGAVSISADIPVIPNIGVKIKGSASSLIYRQSNISTNLYGGTVGGYWNFLHAQRLELQAHVSAGVAWVPANATHSEDGIMDISENDAPVLVSGARADLCAGIGASLLLDSNFKIKLFTDYEAFSSTSGHPWLNSIVLGWSSAWFW